MKRIKSACIEQVLHFQLETNVDHEVAVKMVQREYDAYKRHLDASPARYELLDEEILPDGSIQVKVKKQYSF